MERLLLANQTLIPSSTALKMAPSTAYLIYKHIKWLGVLRSRFA